MRVRRGLLAALGLLGPALAAWAATIETDFIQRPWPHQHTQQIEVGRHQVRWRDRLSRKDGLFAGVRFEAPRDQQTIWKLATDYRDIGTKTPGVTAIKFLKNEPSQQIIQVDVNVLWKKLRLQFEVEREPPTRIRFRMTNQQLGEYRGVCTFEPSRTESAAISGPPGTAVELSTWFHPPRPMPMGLALVVQRIMLLQGVARFLDSLQFPAR